MKSQMTKRMKIDGQFSTTAYARILKDIILFGLDFAQAHKLDVEQCDRWFLVPLMDAAQVA
jgi:hypothetical protein